MVAHTFNLNTLEVEAGGFEFQASLIYKSSSRRVRARNPVSKNKTNTQKAQISSKRFIQHFPHSAKNEIQLLTKWLCLVKKS